MALVLGLEGLQPQVETTPVVELSDVLAAQIEFQDAYQAFIDYKNVCEIVLKAKASTENMDFAGKLLGVSVEDVAVSVESIGGKFMDAWTAFANFWKNFFTWIKGALVKFWDVISNQKSDDTFSIEPKISSGQLEEIAEWANKIAENGKDLAVNAKGFDVASKAESSEKLTTKAAVKAWCKAAKNFIVKMNAAVNKASANLKVLKEKMATIKEQNITGPDTVATKENMKAARYIMMYGPKVINAIKTTLGSVKYQARRVSLTSDPAKKEQEAK